MVSLAAAGLLFVALLVGARAVLSPPVILALLLLVAWPVRRRPGVRPALVAATLLTLLWLFIAYGAFLGPFLAALALAYLLAPAVGWIERHRARRSLAVAAVLVPLLGIAVTTVLLVGPQVADQASALAGKVPSFAGTLLQWLTGIRDRLAGLSFLSADQKSWLDTLDASHLSQLLQAHASEILAAAGTSALGLLRRAGTVLGIVGYLVITPVVLFHLLNDWARLTTFLRSVIPPAARGSVGAFVDEYDRSMGRYVRGALTEATLVGTLTGLGMVLAGVPNALLIAVVGGLCNLIPYVGFVLTALVGAMVALTMPDAGAGLLRVGIVFAIVQLIDGSVTGPRIVGNSVGIHPVWIMVALALSGAFFGFVGLLLAIPLAVLVKMVGSRLLARYRASPTYTAGAPGS
jgi:predicted PurR-regulated permease PerM